MGNTASERADSLHLLGLAQLGFEALPFRNINRGFQRCRGAVPRHGRHQAFDPEQSPISFDGLMFITLWTSFRPQACPEGSA